MNNLSQEIKRRRIERGLTQQELAYLATVPQSGICKIERGSSPSVDTLSRLAKILGTFEVPTVYEWRDVYPMRTRVVIVLIGDEQHRAVYMDDIQRFVVGERTYQLDEIDGWREQR